MDCMYKFEGRVVDVLQYSSLFLTVIGVTGNSLSFITVASKHSKKSSFAVYLCALAVVDSLCLLLFLSQTWVFTVYATDLGKYGSVTCKFVAFSIALLTGLSSWIIVAITVERVVAIVLIKPYRIIYTVVFGYSYVGVTAVCLTLVFSHMLYGIEFIYVDGYALCGNTDVNYVYLKNHFLTWLDFLFLFILPVIIIIVGNLLIVIKVRKSKRQIEVDTANAQVSRKISRHLLVLALLISLSFTIFILPAFLLSCLSRYLFDESSDYQRQNAFIAVAILIRINFSINFFLYVLSGTRFRRLFKTAVCLYQRVQQAPVPRKVQAGTLSANNGHAQAGTVSGNTCHYQIDSI